MVGKIDVERLADMLNLHCCLLQAKCYAERHSQVCSEELEQMLDATFELSVKSLHPMMVAANLRSPDCLYDIDCVGSVRNVAERVLQFTPCDKDEIDEQAFMAADSIYKYVFNMLDHLPYMASLTTRKHCQARRDARIPHEIRMRVLREQQREREQEAQKAAEMLAKLRAVEECRPMNGRLSDYLMWVGERESIERQYGLHRA